jgi:predicted MFS family arabinose efflux permease
MLLAAVALVVHSQAASVSMFITVAVMFGLAFSLVTPSLMALLIDRVRPEARGVAVGTFTAGFDLGVGLGAFVSGRLLELMDFPAMYRLVAGAPLAGLVIFVLVRRTHRREGPSG